MKTCTECKQEKPESAFHRRKTVKNGLNAKCKECVYSKNRSYSRTPEAKALDRARRSLPKYKDCKKIYDSTPKARATQLIYRKDRLKKDPIFKLKYLLRDRFSKAIKGLQKSGSAVKDLGCTGLECKLYLETLFYPNVTTGELMSWDNYGKKWQIDHKVEFNSIDITDRTQLLKILHYTNLQPLWTEDHLKKTFKKET